MFTYRLARPLRMRLLDMRMSDKIRPKGMASGKAMKTMSSAMPKPATTCGKLVTRMVGSKNKCRNLLAFHC